MKKLLLQMIERLKHAHQRSQRGRRLAARFAADHVTAREQCNPTLYNDWPSALGC